MVSITIGRDQTLQDDLPSCPGREINFCHRKRRDAAVPRLYVEILMRHRFNRRRPGPSLASYRSRRTLH